MAARAQRQGCFQAEIVPVTTTIRDDKGTEQSVTVAQDEGIRPGTTMEGLAKLKPAFKSGGSTTAGETGLGVAEEGAALAGCSPLGAGATRHVDGEGVDHLSVASRPPKPVLCLQETRAR